MYKIETRRVSVWYGPHKALDAVSLALERNQVLALIGPSGCGKSTFLRLLNRMNDFVEGFRLEGQVLIDGEDIYAPGVDPVHLRRRVGMVLPEANAVPFFHLRECSLRSAPAKSAQGVSHPRAGLSRPLGKRLYGTK
ncbi:MAG: hypothetical protein KatS3mg026_1339 [Bacteroidia bacterium]|nr:MAG: hypothetical protein KatS3mg026_1339 [Bacteroidia bacterium]